MNLSDIKIGDKVTFQDGKIYEAVSQGGTENVTAVGLLPYEPEKGVEDGNVR